jgi:NAD+ kinase
MKYRFGLVFYFKNLESRQLCKEIISWLRAKNVSFALDEDSSIEELDGIQYLPLSELASNCEFTLVLGGDGSVLKASRHCFRKKTVLVGVHKGTTGFLTTLDENNLYDGLQRLLEHEFRVTKRLMLRAEVFRSGKKISTFFALNDAILKVGLLSRIVSYSVHVNDKFVERYRGDGVVVCTPTGSTGFSLSNGGPIVKPESDTLLMSPICPRQFKSRPIVFDSGDSIKIKVAQEVFYVNSKVFLTIDGQVGFHLQDGDEVVIKAARTKLKMADIYQTDFFELVREKIG